VVTCAHVVEAADGPLHVRWLGGTEPATVHSSTPPPVNGVRAGGDAAVLHVAVTNHACVPLASQPAEVGDRLWAYGITTLRRGDERPPEQFGSLLQVSLDIATGDAPEPFLTLTGAVYEGMSGGPLVNLTTLGVCGVVQSRDRGSPPTVAWAVPIEDALALGAPEDLTQDNPGSAFDLASLRRAQAVHGTLPRRVLSRITPTAVDLLYDWLTLDVGRPTPPLADGDRREWVARQLFTLTLAQLVGALNQVADSERALAAVVFELVAPCTALSAEAPWWFIAGDTATAVRAELDLMTPRLVHLITAEDMTVEMLLRLAYDGRALMLERAGASTTAEVGAAGIDTAQESDLLAAIRKAMGARRDEATISPAFAQQLRDAGLVVQVELGDAPDTALLRSLRDRFPGARFVVRRRGLRVPTDAEDLVVSAVPAVDEANEQAALGWVRLFREKHRVGA
jgi:hypothetical protein